jgi:hypothetical protein
MQNDGYRTSVEAERLNYDDQQQRASPGSLPSLSRMGRYGVIDDRLLQVEPTPACLGSPGPNPKVPQ